MEANRLGNNIQESINLQLDLIKAKVNKNKEYELIPP